AAYRDTPAGAIRRILAERTSVPPGDPVRMAAIIIDSVEQSPAPRRIALGSDSYTVIHNALTERLAELEAGRDLAFSTDFPDL
ncbi:MAG TPA: short-chain dehydrogenase/reductase, partial [Pseudonocardia sp.]|nr:short-chain dehydrogenase/reductase [Pseudonocardia sp.]